MLELDHVFCFVDPAGAPARLEAAGWVLDAGIEHPGQGTRNRRLSWADMYLELVWISAPRDAETSELRLDRRARWRETGASPFGIGLRGVLPEGDFAPYRPPYAPDSRISVHRGRLEDPFLFVMEARPEELPAFRARLRGGNNPGGVARVRVTGPALPWLPAPLEMVAGAAPRMELAVAGGLPVEIEGILALTTPPAPAPPR